MKIFMHYKQREVKKFIRKNTVLNTSYIARSFSFEKEFVAFLYNLEKYYEQIGDAANISKVSQQRIYYHTSLKGVDPKTLKRVMTYKREMTWMAAFHCLTNISDILQHSLYDINDKLKEGEDTLGQIILSAIQSGLISNEDIKRANETNEVYGIWQKLMAYEQFKLLENKLKINLTNEDIKIILAEVFSKMNA